jgi:hypothetical protein
MVEAALKRRLVEVNYRQIEMKAEEKDGRRERI